MTVHGSTSEGAAAGDTREALRQRCLTLVRRWHPLASAGWDRRAAYPLADELELIATTSERLGLESVTTSALELSTFLCSFLDDALEPRPRDLERLAAMINALGNALTELSGAPTAAVHALHRDAPIAVESPVASSPTPAADAPAADDETDPSAPPHHLPRTLCLLGAGMLDAPDLLAALRERGYETRPFEAVEPLIAFLRTTRPGALLLDARALRHLARIRATLGNGDEAGSPPPLLVFSRGGDLGDRLLAMRAGATALFELPVDSLRVVARLDELLAQATQTPWRVLLAEHARDEATERARGLAERGMTVRIATTGESALTALAEFRPDLVIVDEELPDVAGVELIQLLRQHAEHAAAPIVLMSRHADAGHRFDAIAAGGDEVLVKPVKPRHLGSAVLSRLKRAQWLRELVGGVGGRDPRSGLYPRNVLIERLAAAHGDRSAMLLCIGLDHANELRERIGLTGLAALDAHVGQLLRAQLDGADVAAHYQDFHYAALIQRHSRAEATRCAERVRSAFAETPWLHGEQTHALSVSIGLAMLGDADASLDAIVTNAEAARLAAAHMGGDRVLWFEAREAALLPTDPLTAVRALLRRPLRPDQGRFTYAPLVALAGKLNGQFELRFHVRATQAHAHAVAYAELAGAGDARQLAQIDRWLLRHTLELREEQLRRGRQLRVFVPQSVESLLEADLPWWLERELKERHLSGTGLTFVLPGSPLVDARTRARERIEALRPLGIRVCIGDFGRDWALVHALKELHADFVRLDPLLVQELGNARSIADTILALVRKAHTCGAAVIAPDTDNTNRAHALLRLGVDYASGPAFGQALAQPEFDFDRPLA